MRNDVLNACEAWGDSFTPACACGCGEPVPLYRGNPGGSRVLGEPSTYVNHAHHNWARGAEHYRLVTAARMVTLEQKHADRGDLPIEDFRVALRRIKDRKGYSWPKLANAAGISEGQLKMLMFGKGREWVTRELATSILRRLAGLGTPATTYEKRVAPKQVKNTNQAIRSIGMDQPKITYTPPNWAMYDGHTFAERKAAQRKAREALPL